MPIPHTRLRWLCLAVVCALVLSSCAEDERRGIRLTPTSTVETGVRALVDNCPGPTTVILAVRDDVLWEIEGPPVEPEVEEEADNDSEDSNDEAGEEDAVRVPGPPGIAEFVVGQTPDGWTTTTALEGPLQAGIRYTIRTQPDGQSIDFSTPDLAGGLLWDGQGNSRFNPNLINAECSEPADVGAFARNIAVLGLLGVTAAATVLIALILLLFVVTRRFSRVRSIQKKARRDAGIEPQRPRARSKS